MKFIKKMIDSVLMKINKKKNAPYAVYLGGKKLSEDDYCKLVKATKSINDIFQGYIAIYDGLPRMIDGCIFMQFCVSIRKDGKERAVLYIYIPADI